jgi:serine/threonine protein kinase
MAEMPDRIGPYEIRGVLGEGGMGQVLLAWDPALHREVALKRVTRQRDGVWRERFLREARALARIDDPHVVRVFACDAGDEPWLAMERLDGVDLRRHLRERGPLDPAVLRDACRQILTGLAAAHAAGILHRDLKPSNLLRCQGGVYKLIDFGLADDADHDLTDPSLVVGTERYLAPERLQGRPASPASDLWGLAVTLVELATGRSPAAGLPADPVLPGQPAEFAAWLGTCMAVQPLDRFADAGAALAALAGIPAPQWRCV